MVKSILKTTNNRPFRDTTELIAMLTSGLSFNHYHTRVADMHVLK